MKVSILIVAISCLASSLPAAMSLPDISTLKGPQGTSTVPPTGNGTVTDPASTSFGTGTSSRLALYVPGTVYKDYPGWLALYKALVFQGIPVKVTKDINVAKTHNTVLAYQAMQSKYLGLLDSLTWSSYVSGGNTLIAVGMTSTDLTLKSLFGVTPNTNTNANARAAIVLQAPSATVPASSVNAQFDLTDTRDAEIPLWRTGRSTGFTTIGYTASAGTFALGKYRTNSGSSDNLASITLRSVGTNGKAVAIGLDLGAYIGESNGGKTSGIPRAYNAEYEPGYDNFFRIIKSLYQTSTTAGLVTSWPVPGNMGVHFSWTYDIDAQDSYELAYTCALDLQSRGIGGTINWQAKLVKDAYDVASFSLYYRSISMVEALGNMELSSHSVSHSPNLLRFPIGTGKEIWNGPTYKEDNYFPFIGQCINNATIVPGATACDTPNNSMYFYTIGGSLFGEARVSKYILEAISINNSPVVSFRTGHLLYPDALPQVLAASGFKYSSSGASNDQNTHMPYQPFFNMAYNQAVDIIEIPLSGSDEDGLMNGDWALPGDSKYPDGSYAYQQYAIVQKIAKYGGQYTFLIHPTSSQVPGLGAVPFSDKLNFQKLFAEKVKPYAYFDTMGGRGQFHSTRIQTGIDVAVSGTTATVTVTLPTSIVDLTLRVPTTWSFKSSTVAAKATPGAVVLVNKVAAGTVTLTFQTSGTADSTSAPAPGPSVTTTTMSIATPTIPPPTPTPALPRLLDDFSDPQRYNSGVNVLGFATGDDNTVTQKTSVQGDWLLLNVNANTFWYSLVGNANTCNDYSKYTKLSLAVRYPTSTRIGFNVVLQTTLGSDCTGLSQYSFNATPMIKSATAGSDGWFQLDIPLTNFANATLTRLRGVSLSTFAPAGQVEIDYVYFT